MLMTAIRTLFFMMMFCTTFAQAQVRILLNAIPKETPKNAKIYLASSLNDWNPHDEKYRLSPQPNGLYTLLIPEANGSFEYKFTLGTWDRSEADSVGNAVQNHKIVFNGAPQTIQNEISAWTKPSEKKSTASPQVKILQEKYFIPQLNTSRRIWIYLPPDYATSHKRFPVIYMPDAQNLFDEALSFSGEWKVDETLDGFFRTGKLGAIVVGIDHGGTERLNEYAPWKNEKYGGGKGAAFAEFLVKTLKPDIDRNFRTRPERRSTAMIGSSMGGLISFYTGTRYPAVFGKLGIFSPSFWFAETSLHHYLQNSVADLRKTKFYFVAGQHESEDMIPDLKEVIAILKKNKNVPSKYIRLKTDEHGSHSETYWARELPDAILWLLHP